MAESKKDPLEVAYEQLLNKLENFKPRPYLNPEEVEFCRDITRTNLKAAWGMCDDGYGNQPRLDVEELVGSEARDTIRKELFRPEPEEFRPKTKIQLSLPVGTAQLLEIWAKREERTVTSCVMEAVLRGLSAMKADGHIPKTVLDENEYTIRLDQIHEEIKNAMADNFFDNF